MSTYIEATFIGAGDNEYQPGQSYQLHVRQHLKNKITIVATHGYEFKQVAGTERSYRGLAQFLGDWQIQKVVRPTHGLPF